MKIARIGSFLMLTMIMLTSCEEKAFDVVLNLVFSHEYTVNTTSATMEEYTISKGEINDEIAEVPDTASLDSIKITSMYVSIKTLSNNSAEEVTVSSSAKHPTINGGDYFTIFTDNTIEIPAVGDSIEIGVENLNSMGVQYLKDLFNQLILDPSIDANEEIGLMVESTPVPSGSTIHALVTVYLQGTAIFEYKTELVSNHLNNEVESMAMIRGLY
ncbi:MAG: hypothetical protein GVY19_11925 [Bacteroidetes bacterium]|jgi:hypothetical protein|nr:hypothetical protein [Bacteroidota bacterium]